MTQQTSLIVQPRWRDTLATWLNTKTSARTRSEYGKIVYAALTELGELADLTPDKLAAYRGKLIRAQNAERLSSSTVALRLTALQGFLNFARLAGECRVPADALELLLKRPPVSRHSPANLSEADVLALLAACPSGRDRALIALALETGLRSAELVAL